MYTWPVLSMWYSGGLSAIVAEVVDDTTGAADAGDVEEELTTTIFQSDGKILINHSTGIATALPVAADATVIEENEDDDALVSKEQQI